MNNYDGDLASMIAFLLLAGFPLSFAVGEGISRYSRLSKDKRETILNTCIVIVACLWAFLTE